MGTSREFSTSSCPNGLETKGIKNAQSYRSADVFLERLSNLLRLEGREKRGGSSGCYIERKNRSPFLRILGDGAVLETGRIAFSLNSFSIIALKDKVRIETNIALERIIRIVECRKAKIYVNPFKSFYFRIRNRTYDFSSPRVLDISSFLLLRMREEEASALLKNTEYLILRDATLLLLCEIMFSLQSRKDFSRYAAQIPRNEEEAQSKFGCFRAVNAEEEILKVLPEILHKKAVLYHTENFLFLESTFKLKGETISDRNFLFDVVIFVRKNITSALIVGKTEASPPAPCSSTEQPNPALPPSDKPIDNQHTSLHMRQLIIENIGYIKARKARNRCKGKAALQASRKRKASDSSALQIPENIGCTGEAEKMPSPSPISPSPPKVPKYTHNPSTSSASHPATPQQVQRKEQARHRCRIHPSLPALWVLSKAHPLRGPG